MENFLSMLKGLNDTRKLEAVNVILAKFRERNAANSKFYNDPNQIQQVMDSLYGMIETTDPFLDALIRIEGAGPYSIFSYIMNHDFSDILIYHEGINFSDATEVKKYVIPPELRAIYMVFVQHFIENIMFYTNQKFDTAYSVMDAEIGIFRFNLIHGSLSVSERPIVVIRKQTIAKGFNMNPELYLGSINATEKQIEYINQFAYHGNMIVFGETGSGKTTLLKYMGNYRLAEKRNLCTIEDTRELNIPVPLALITNAHKNIKDLFTASLRQNPSHVIIGETRTDEIVDILESALTINVLTTIHANSFLRAIERILFMSAKRNMNLNDMRSLINSAVDGFAFMESRKLKELWVKKPTVTSNVYEAYEKVE